jgi:hypothetical protein
LLRALQRNALDGLHQCIPQGDPWAELLWSLAEQLVADDPAARPELPAVMLHDFLTAGQVRLDAACCRCMLGVSGVECVLRAPCLVRLQGSHTQKRAAGSFVPPDLAAADGSVLPELLLQHYTTARPITEPFTITVGTRVAVVT